MLLQFLAYASLAMIAVAGLYTAVVYLFTLLPI